jgi:hypothetical protein
MALYDVAVGGLPQASDINQLVDIFLGTHDIGTITFAPPVSVPSTTGFSLLAQSGSTLGAGAYNYVFTYVTGYYKSDGTLVQTGETTASSALAITTASGSTTVKVTVPVPSVGSVCATRIYRTAVGGSTYGLIATIKDGTTIYVDSTADASRGAAAPTTNNTGTNLNINNGYVSGLTQLTGMYGTIAKSTDEWLRINDDVSHTNGVYFGTSLVRTDGTLQVGNAGANLNVTSSVFTYTGGNQTFKTTTNSTVGHQVQNSAGTTVFDVDTTNIRVGINTNAPAYTLDVNGTLRATGVITSTLATGTAPFTVTSTTPVANLAIGGNAGSATKLLTARTIAASGDATGTATSFDGSANITIPLTLANVATAGTYKSVTVNAKGLVTGGTNPTTIAGYGITDATPFQTISATTAATAGWYRIAQSAVNIGSNSGLFQVDFTGTGVRGRALLSVSSHDGSASGSGVSQLGFSSTNLTLGLTQARVVYNTTPTGNYAYVEIYNPTALAITYTVDVIDATGWTLVSPSTAGSIPSGYTSESLTLASGFNTNSNVTTALQLVSNVATGTAPMVVTSNTKVANLNADMVDGYSFNQDVQTTASPSFNKVTSTVATGTAPFTVTSTTKVTNLNVDQVDGYHLNQDVQTTASPSFNRVTSTIATGTAPFTVTSTTVVTNLNADMVDGYHVSPTGSSPGTGILSTIPVIKPDSVMEIGKYLDFHDTGNATQTDLDARLYVTGNGSSGGGTLSFTGNALDFTQTGNIFSTIQTPDAGYRQFRFQSPTKEHISWTRDASGGKALEVYLEPINGYTGKQLLLVSTGGVVTVPSITSNGDIIQNNGWLYTQKIVGSTSNADLIHIGPNNYGQIDTSNSAARFQYDSNNYFLASGSGTAVYTAGIGVFAFKVGDNGTTHSFLQAQGSGLQFLGGGGVQVRSYDNTAYAAIYATAFTVSSTRDLKKNIVDYVGNASDLIKGTQVHEYHYNEEEDDSKKHVGLIFDESPYELQDRSGIGIDQYAMNSLSWKAIQEILVRLENMEARLANLEV